MDEFSRNLTDSPPGKLKFWKYIWMIFPGFFNKLLLIMVNNSRKLYLIMLTLSFSWSCLFWSSLLIMDCSILLSSLSSSVISSHCFSLNGFSSAFKCLARFSNRYRLGGVLSNSMLWANQKRASVWKHTLSIAFSYSSSDIGFFNEIGKILFWKDRF